GVHRPSGLFPPGVADNRSQRSALMHFRTWRGTPCRFTMRCDSSRMTRSQVPVLVHGGTVPSFIAFRAAALVALGSFASALRPDDARRRMSSGMPPCMAFQPMMKTPGGFFLEV